MTPQEFAAIQAAGGPANAGNIDRAAYNSQSYGAGGQTAQHNGEDRPWIQARLNQLGIPYQAGPQNASAAGSNNPYWGQVMPQAQTAGAQPIGASMPQRNGSWDVNGNYTDQVLAQPNIAGTVAANPGSTAARPGVYGAGSYTTDSRIFNPNATFGPAVNAVGPGRPTPAAPPPAGGGMYQRPTATIPTPAAPTPVPTTPRPTSPTVPTPRPGLVTSQKSAGFNFVAPGWNTGKAWGTGQRWG